LNGIIIDTIWY